MKGLGTRSGGELVRVYGLRDSSDVNSFVSFVGLGECARRAIARFASPPTVLTVRFLPKKKTLLARSLRCCIPLDLAGSVHKYGLDDARLEAIRFAKVRWCVLVPPSASYCARALSLSICVSPGLRTR